MDSGGSLCWYTVSITSIAIWVLGYSGPSQIATEEAKVYILVIKNN
jgi:hypothetical protein